MVTTGFRITPEEAVECYEWGQVRTRNSAHRKDNWGLRNNDPVEDARRQTVGMMGEYALAKFFGVDPHLTRTVNTFKAPDLVVDGLPPLQVKASERARELTIRPDAKDGEIYILARVTLSSPINRFGAWVELLGWIYPEVARQWAEAEPSLIRDPQNRKSPAIFIPVERLSSMDRLVQVAV